MVAAKRKPPAITCSVFTLGQQLNETNEGTQEDLNNGNRENKLIFRKIVFTD